VENSSDYGSRVDEAFHALRLAIEERRLLPGEALRLNALSKELNMSITPVREAIRLLESEGLVERFPHRGAIVSKVSDTDVVELSLIRTIVEPLAVSLATIRATDEELRGIREAHELLALRIQDGDRPTEMARLVSDWHLAIYETAHSRYLTDFIGLLWSAIRINSLWHPRRADHSIEEHDRILEAMERRRPHEAADAMRDHLISGVAFHLAGREVDGYGPGTDALKDYEELLSKIRTDPEPHLPHD